MDSMKINPNVNVGPALTWDDLAKHYDRGNGGRKARTMPMDNIFQWAQAQPSKFYVCPKEGTIHFIPTHTP